MDIHNEYILLISESDVTAYGMLLQEAYNKYEYSNINMWFKELVNLIVIDPEISKKQLREKIQLFKQMLLKLKAESRHPSGWQNWTTVIKAVVPMTNIYLYFNMNGNLPALLWLTQSTFVPPKNTDIANESKYKSMIAGMMQVTSKGISIMQSKLQMFDEDKAKHNPAVANLNILYKLNTHI